MGAEQSQIDSKPDATGEYAKNPKTNNYNENVIQINNENVIEIKRIKKKLDLIIQAIERMINIMENDSKFIRFSIIILIIMFAFYGKSFTFSLEKSKLILKSLKKQTELNIYSVFLGPRTPPVPSVPIKKRFIINP